MIKLNFFFFLVFTLPLFISCQTDTRLQIQVGVSKAVINPPIGAFIAGDKQNRTFTGVLDSLYAKALIIHDGKESIVLVTLDCIGLLYQDLQKIRESAALLDLGIPFSPENIVISSTHTHSGPDVVGLWGKDFSESGVNPEYMDFLIKTVVSQIEAAAKNLKPVAASYAETIFGEEWVANICGEEIDRSVTVLQFLDMQGTQVASLTNFACHPTYLDAVFSEVSADYVAGFYREMENQLGGEHLFLQGAIGGWIQPVDKNADYQKALSRGKQLAESVISSLTDAKALTGSDIHFEKATIPFPVENEAWQQLAAGGIIHRKVTDSIESEVAWFSVGNASFATHPGETAPIYGLQTKEMMPDGPKFILGLSQDALGYIVKPVYFEDQNLPHAAYLTRMSLGKQTGPILMETLKNLSKANKPNPVNH